MAVSKVRTKQDVLMSAVQQTTLYWNLVAKGRVGGDDAHAWVSCIS
jgi:hypothetical protein